LAGTVFFLNLTQRFKKMCLNNSKACGMYNVITLSSIPEDTLVNLSEKFLNFQKNQGIQITRINKFIIEKI
jgi:hypothetical protein